MAAITADEIAAINERIRQMAAVRPAIEYGLGDDVPVRRAALQRVVDLIPAGSAEEAAAWLIRALVLIQPFPDANHRTALAAADLLLGRAGLRFRPTVEASERFQRSVSGARYRLLLGYDDAPLSILDTPSDEVMGTCMAFVREATLR